MLFVLLVLGLVSKTIAVSSGAVDICNAFATSYGCTDFKNNVRAMCQEKGRIMQWVTKPVISAEHFDLFAGEEDNKVLEYTPGEWIKINLRSKTYNKQYRGLLLYAIDHNDLPIGYPNHKSGDPTKLGTWDFTDRQSLFHSHCPRTVLHASGELKPYLSSFQFLPPKDFEGEIFIGALIKTGPANEGEFWYPPRLVLKKAKTASSKPGQKWYKGKVGQSCAEVCSAEEMLCDGDRMDDIKSANDFSSKVLNNVVCNKPALVRCSDLGVSSGDDGSCYFSNDENCKSLRLPVSKDKPTCDTKSDEKDVGARVCPCKCDGQKGPCKPPPTKPKTTTKEATRKSTPKPQAGSKPCANPGEPGACCDSGKCNQQNTYCNAGRCVVKRTCVYGDAGCPCTLDKKTCASHLACQDGVCAISEALEKKSGGSGKSWCSDKVGQAGCWCTEAKGCVSANLIPKNNADGRCYCAVNLVLPGGQLDVSSICQRGDLGCPCASQRCRNGGVCQLVGRSTLCLDGGNSSSTLFISISMIIISLIGMLI